MDSGRENGRGRHVFDAHRQRSASNVNAVDRVAIPNDARNFWVKPLSTGRPSLFPDGELVAVIWRRLDRIGRADNSKPN
jgi:hypothetical protein